MLLQAYRLGIFPMAEGKYSQNIQWFEPRRRGILPLNTFHIPRRLRRALKKESFTISFNTSFSAIILGCADFTASRRDTWINEELIQVYTQLHHHGFAHSVETWYNRELVGGLYGVAIAGAFFGESMFSRHTHASKAALIALVKRLCGLGFKLLDIQFYTPHLGQFGAVEISRQAYQQLLKDALETEVCFIPIDRCGHQNM